MDLWKGFKDNFAKVFDQSPKLLPTCPDCGEQSELTEKKVCRGCEELRNYQQLGSNAGC